MGIPPYILGGLAALPYYRESYPKRVSSFDRTGGNKDFIVVKPWETKVLADIDGTGIIRHVWCTIAAEDKYYLRSIVLRMYWDGEPNPSVETPIGDFFGIGHGVAKHFISLPVTMTCDKGFNCYFPMPFSKNARIEIENQSDKPVNAFYYHIDYEELPVLDGNMLRFHAKWRRENPTEAEYYPPGEEGKNTSGEGNYLVLEAYGRGRYVGCILSIYGLKPGWWGEGDDMIFVDGEKWPPSIHGTGTEDYIGSAWGFNREFYGPFHGFPLMGNPDWTGPSSMYRFHIEDPIFFRRSIKVTIEHGHANDRSDDWSSIAYWYQNEPHYEFTRLPPPELRRPREAI
ncbi:MAG: glycoside hydrolase family 172 protein [Candidatus Bathyarchaeia archaeon]